MGYSGDNQIIAGGKTILDSFDGWIESKLTKVYVHNIPLAMLRLHTKVVWKNF